MDRRTFVAGLAGTTAAVGFAGLPQAAPTAWGRYEGVRFISAADVRRVDNIPMPRPTDKAWPGDGECIWFTPGEFRGRTA